MKPGESQRMSHGDRINGLFHLLIDGVFLGVITYNPLILTIYILSSWDIQVGCLKIYPKQKPNQPRIQPGKGLLENTAAKEMPWII